MISLDYQFCQTDVGSYTEGIACKGAPTISSYRDAGGGTVSACHLFPAESQGDLWGY